MGTKQRSVRLPDDVSAVLENIATRYDMDETSVITRALRFYLKKVQQDDCILLSKESTEELPIQKTPT